MPTALTENDWPDFEAALADIRTFKRVLTRLETTLESLREAALQDRLSRLPACDVPVTEHRREHRMGRVPKIDSDPELQAFITARLDRLTYQQIATDIAAHFSPDRRVHPATVHRWAQRRKASATNRDLLR